VAANAIRSVLSPTYTTDKFCMFGAPLQGSNGTSTMCGAGDGDFGESDRDVGEEGSAGSWAGLCEGLDGSAFGEEGCGGCEPTT